MQLHFYEMTTLFNGTNTRRTTRNSMSVTGGQFGPR